MFDFFKKEKPFQGFQGFGGGASGLAMFSGKEETTKVIPKCIAMAYHADGTPKRTVGVFYEDIMMVWSQDMDESEFVDTREGVISNPLSALTDKQFTAST